MTELDQQRINEWIRDAFAILCVRVPGVSTAEHHLRLGFETILRQLGTPPLRVLAKAAPPMYPRVTASAADLRHIMKALDCCLATLQRYDTVLSNGQRRIQFLVRATRRFAEEELRNRAAATTPAATPRASAAPVAVTAGAGR